jgi:hypothetical protein
VISQRSEVPQPKRAPQSGALWDPHVPRRKLPDPSDAYVVVEDKDEGTVVLLVARWPEIDGLGRLVFPDEDPLLVDILEARLEAILRRGRQAGNQRGLRIGDVFWVRSLFENESKLSGDPAAWGFFIDITRAAREAAKAALYGAAAPRVSDEHAKALGLVEQHKQPPEPPPIAPSAGATV